MITKVNAKINLGLYITGRRPDGYHTLLTCFYPVGILSGTPASPWPFGDLLEIIPREDEPGNHRFCFTGLPIDCPLEKNLVVKAVRLFGEEYSRLSGQTLPALDVRLEKHIPFGAGLGGGSADASFALTLLNQLTGSPFDENLLIDMGAHLGADCPFFILNRPCIASGIGEVLEPADDFMSGKYLVLVKPDVSVSTREAFAGITPEETKAPLRESIHRPMTDWQQTLTNQFEEHIFSLHPVLPQIKRSLYDAGAEYASMSGSGSALYGIFADTDTAQDCYVRFSNEPGLYSALMRL